MRTITSLNKVTEDVSFEELPTLPESNEGKMRRAFFKFLLCS